LDILQTLGSLEYTLLSRFFTLPPPIILTLEKDFKNSLLYEVAEASKNNYKRTN